MPRPKRGAPPAGPYAELLALESESGAVAARGDKRAIALHRQVCSWLDMVEHAGGDAEIATLFGIFASEGKARLAELRSHPQVEG